jgi:hypothetical protein
LFCLYLLLLHQLDTAAAFPSCILAIVCWSSPSKKRCVGLFSTAISLCLFLQVLLGWASCGAIFCRGSETNPLLHFALFCSWHLLL